MHAFYDSVFRQADASRHARCDSMFASLSLSSMGHEARGHLSSMACLILSGPTCETAPGHSVGDGGGGRLCFCLFVVLCCVGRGNFFVMCVFVCCVCVRARVCCVV